MAERAPKEDQQAVEEDRLYKGDRVKLSDLRGKSWIIAQTIPGQWDDYYRRKRPTFVLLSNVSQGGPDRCNINFYNMRGSEALHYAYTSILPAKTEVNILTGRQGAVLAKEFATWEANNIQSLLVRPIIQLGADPEIFVVDKDNEVIPAWKFLPDKKHGLGVSNSGIYGAKATVYWDGFQAEFTTRPATCLAYFMDEIAYGLRAVHKAARAFDNHAKLSAESVVPVSDKILRSAEDKYVEFGCMPSHSVYGFEGQAHSGREVPIRFAGGHIHIGVPHPDLKPRLEQCVKAMDAILGLASVSLFESMDNPARREFYGLPGEFRLPPHGLEYRTLSNAWLCHPAIGNMVIELARGAFATGYNNMLKHWKTPQEEVVEIIRASDAPKARKALTDNEDFFEKVLNVTALGHNVKVAKKVFMNDIRDTLKDPMNLEDNWRIHSDWLTHCEGQNMNFAKASVTIARGEKV